MSKTFKSAVTITGSRNLLVSTDIGMDSGFFLEVRDKHEEPQAICFENRTAPALALAILEAAGVVHHDPDDTPYEKSERTENMGALNMSAFYLAKHVNDAEKAEFLAKEQAKLEAEAFKLRRAYLVGRTGFDSWNELTDADRENWLAVARRAREMRAEK